MWCLIFKLEKESVARPTQARPCGSASPGPKQGLFLPGAVSGPGSCPGGDPTRAPLCQRQGEDRLPLALLDWQGSPLGV